MNNKLSIYYMILSMVFCLSYFVGSCLDIKVIDVFGSFPVSCGIFLIPFMYVVSDCLVEIYGFKYSCYTMVFTIIIQICILLIIKIVYLLPPAPYWNGNEHFSYVFNSTIRTNISAIFAFTTAFLTNAYVMSKMKTIHKGKYFKTRAIVSTIFGELMDSLVFFTLAFLFVIPFDKLLNMIVFNTILKTGYEAILLPITERVSNYIKEKENIDIYDSDTSYLQAFKNLFINKEF